MFSTSIKLLLRSQCCRSLISSSMHEQRLLQMQPNLIKPLAGNVRFITDSRDPFRSTNSTNEPQSGEKKIRRKTPEIPKITLLDTSDNISICTMENAIKIAEGRHLRLIKIIDMDLRTKRPVYKLMTEAQYLEEELAEKKKIKEKKNNSVKGEKILIMSSGINENDFQIKLRKAQKWIEKNFEIRVTISAPSDSNEEQEKMFKEFEETFDGKARFLQKRSKGNDLKFTLSPLPNATSQGNQKQSKKEKNEVIREKEEEDESEKQDPEIRKSKEYASEQPKENILSKI